MPRGTLDVGHVSEWDAWQGLRPLDQKQAGRQAAGRREGREVANWGGWRFGEECDARGKGGRNRRGQEVGAEGEDNEQRAEGDANERAEVPHAPLPLTLHECGRLSAIMTSQAHNVPSSTQSLVGSNSVFSWMPPSQSSANHLASVPDPFERYGPDLFEGV